MAPLIVASLFGLSGFLLIWMFMNQMDEKRMMERRLRSLHEVPTIQKTRSDLSTKIDFTEKDKRRAARVHLSPLQMAIFITCWIALAVLVTLRSDMPPLNKLIVLGIFPIVVFRIANLVAKKKRLEKIERELPGALDLIVICLEAGLGINSAMLRVANEMEGSPLGKELKQTFNLVSAGLPLDEAMKDFAKRTEVEDAQAIVTSIIQSQQFGTAMATTFRVQADTMREKYKMKIKEKMQKIPVKILFPLVLFILPALFVVILGPAVIKIGNQLGGTG